MKKENDLMKRAEALLIAGEESKIKEIMQYNVDSVFKEPKRKYKSLGMGLHNGKFYFGSVIYNDGKPVSVVITHDGEYYTGEDIKFIFGLDYREDFDEEALDFTWSTEAMKAWINGKIKKIKLKELFKKIRDKNDYYIDHLNPAIHSYVACDIISQYFYQLFDWKGRTYFHAEKGSGKTKQSKMYWLLGFNTMWISKTTESSLFRSIEATSGTPIVDNFDNLSEETKKAILHCIQVGAGSEARYRLVEGEEKRRTKKFLCYSPLVINNIFGMDEVTLDRSHEINLLKTNTEKRKRHPNKDDPFWEKTRNELRYSAFQNWEKVLKTYLRLRGMEIESMYGRDLDNELPNLTIAYLVGKDVYEEVLQYVLDYYGKKKIKNLDADWKYALFKRIEELLKGKEATWIRYKDLTDDMMPELKNVNMEHKDYKKEWNSLNRWIAKTIGSVVLFQNKRQVKGVTEVEFKKKDVVRWMELQNYYITENKSTISTISTNSTLSTYSTQTGREGREGRVVDTQKGEKI